MTPETIQYLAQPELRRLLQTAQGKRDKAIILTAYSYGLRASEIGLLRRDDVDFDRSRIRVHRLKNSLSGEYMLRPNVAKVLKSYLRTRDDPNPALFLSRRGQPISRRTLDWLMKKYGERAGIPEEKRHFHVLKHSIATHLLDAGADIMFVKDWLGHKNIQNTLVYARLTDGRRDEAARRVFASSKIV